MPEDAHIGSGHEESFVGHRKIIERLKRLEGARDGTDERLGKIVRAEDNDFDSD